MESLASHLQKNAIEKPVDNACGNRKKWRCRSTPRFMFMVVFVILISSLFFFDIELQIYWSPQQQIISSQRIFDKLTSFNSNQENINKENNLLTNKTEFDELLSYYSKISNISTPNSWIHLNEQLFCPIRYSQSLQPTNTISSAGERILKYIYNTQFVKDCYDPKHKYIIFDMARTKGIGIGAMFNGGILKWMVRAMMSNRIFLINGKFEWAKGVQHCSQFIGMECYFLPPSNCNAHDILSNVDKKDIWEGSKPSHCTLGDENDKELPWCTERIIYTNKHTSGWNPKNKNINQWIHSHLIHNMSIFSNFVQFKAVVQSFIFRLKPDVRSIIMKKVRNAFIKSLSLRNNSDNDDILMYNFDPYKSISFPIRASDKCHDNILGLHGEMDCWSKQELFLMIQSIHILNKNVDTIIFTSEDWNFLDELIKCIRYQTHCENTTKLNIFDNYLKFKWKIIINHEDTTPSIGNAIFRTHKEENAKNFKFQDDIDIDLEHDVVVGAFSSMMLQMNSKYVVYTKSSSWLDNIWTMASSLNCESILWSKQLQFDGFTSSNNIDTKIKNEFDRLRMEYGRPSYLPQYNKKYATLNRYCFELKQFGTLNKKTKWKHILYPIDLWDKIHSLNLSPKLFYSLFGIEIHENGWDNYCNRYTKLPFDTDVDYGV